ncbi:M42 family metallopeptidase [Bythopirellula polymerisocia]|uniref:Putative aminopeptidase YsdC n=1 Tax=Bythopirellula polymerisocia TaxID=2528003 RepID=A0A5C6CTA8_9BACT|nr:M42 family metallopeptidase [Bythopirellula polymerisocia]TWU25979.1 putative aminopeptidase YsdC [Bythopirellula polymerisocia]
MEASAKQFFQLILETPSPSGYEQPVQNIVRSYAEEFADEVTTDLHGNVIAGCNVGAPLRVMFAGHADQIGLLVTHINDQGFIYTNTIGGWDPQQLIGQRMTIYTNTGPVPAIISRKPIHLLDQEERKQVVKPKDMWLDIGAKSKEEAAEIVRIGDPVTLELGYQELRNGLANSPGMDDKTGLWVCMEALRRAKKRGLEVALYAVATVQEEIGLRGAHTSAYGVNPQVGIAVDVTHATDCPTIDKTQEGDIKLGGGPVIYRGPNMNPVVVDRLREASEYGDIPCQWAASGRGTGTDANAIQLSRAGVAAGLVSVPNRYMHSAVETIALADLDACADLLATFAHKLTADADFIPR